MSAKREMGFKNSGVLAAALTPIAILSLIVLIGLLFHCYGKFKHSTSLSVLPSSMRTSSNHSQVAADDQVTSLPSYDEAIQMPPDYSPPDISTSLFSIT